MLVDMTFHHGIFNGFQDTEQTRLKCLFGYFQFQRAITRKICKPELQVLFSAHRHIMIDKSIKFHHNSCILNGF